MSDELERRELVEMAAEATADKIARLEAERAALKNELNRKDLLLGSAYALLKTREQEIDAALSRAESADKSLVNEHEAFLSVHRDNMMILNRNMELKAILAAKSKELEEMRNLLGEERARHVAWGEDFAEDTLAKLAQKDALISEMRAALERIATDKHFPNLKFPKLCEHGGCECIKMIAEDALARLSANPPESSGAEEPSQYIDCKELSDILSYTDAETGERRSENRINPEMHERIVIDFIERTIAKALASHTSTTTSPASDEKAPESPAGER